MNKEKKKKINKKKKLTVAQLRENILSLFKSHPKKRFNPKQIAQRLRVSNNKMTIKRVLDQLVADDKVVPLGDYKYKLKRNPFARRDRKVIEGYIDMTRTGNAYLVCKDLEEDVFIHAKNLNGAMDKDRVSIEAWKARNGRRPEGEVEEILERATTYFLGTLKVSKNFGFVLPDKDEMPVDIYVRAENFGGAEDGDKVVVRIIKWHDKKQKNPEGEITTVLRDSSMRDIEMQAVLINNGFNLDFPKAALAEAGKLDATITDSEVEKRRDMRGIPTFTIDPADAKDFDDALSIVPLEDGGYEIGVHIADVSHFVRPGTALDEEALDRSTSVYLVDRVLPMLPERISNELCSLRPDEDKYTFSAVFDFDKNDKIVKRWFGKTLIHSDRRFAYEEAQAVLDEGKGDFYEELKTLNRIAKKLRKQRFKAGAISFETDEVRFILDDTGAPVDIYVKERRDTNLLIEDFMLLANREVAEFIYKKGKSKEIPFVYRVHDLPDMEKVKDLSLFAKELGFEMEYQTPRQVAKSYNNLFKLAKEEDALKLLAPLAIRTMSKAEYTTENIGHYGLGFDYYTHFTSPIRRYSDVLVHRILQKNLGSNFYRTNKVSLEARCKHISLQERKAISAERESIKYMQVEYIEQHIGDVFDGLVSGMIDRGIFVELKESKCEGFIGFNTFEEPFELPASRLKAIGRRSGRVIKMGDKLRVKILSTDLERKRIEMEIVNDELAPKSRIF